MNYKLTFWKFISLILTIVVVVLTFKECNKKPCEFIPTTTIVRDTIYIEQPKQDVPIYTPPISHTEKPKIPTIPPEDNTALREAFISLADSFYSTHIYKDTVRLLDTSNNNVGWVGITDSISRNKILSRDVSYQLIFPTIKETITTVVEKKKHTKFYVGVGGYFNKHFLTAAKGSFLIQNKKENIFSIDAIMFIHNEQPSVGITKYWKIGK